MKWRSLTSSLSSKQRWIFFGHFPENITANGEAHRRACEVTDHLTAEELLVLYGYFHKSDISPMSQNLMLSKKHSDKIGMEET